MNFIAAMGAVAFSFYVVTVVTIHDSMDTGVLMCSEDYAKVPQKYKRLCVKEYKNELQERRKQYYY